MTALWMHSPDMVNTQPSARKTGDRQRQILYVGRYLADGKFILIDPLLGSITLPLRQGLSQELESGCLKLPI